MWTLLCTAAAVAGPEVVVADSPEGRPDARVVAGDGATLSLVYGGEQEGAVGACACDAYPKGGLGRVRTMTEAIRAADPSVPVLLLNPGAWRASANAGGGLAPEAVDRNVHLDRALGVVGFDALNVSYRDRPSLPEVEGAVSATHGPVAVRTFDLDGLRVVVTGVSRAGLPFLQPEGLSPPPPVEAVTGLALRPEDLVVVLAYDVGADAKALAAVPGVDVVIDAARWIGRYDPVRVGDALWVRSWDASTRLGELRLWVEDGRVVRAVDRMIDLGPDVPVDREIARIARDQARTLAD